MTDVDFELSGPAFWLIAGLFILLAGIQLSGIYRQRHALKRVRLFWRFGLNFLLWLSILGLVLQPKFHLWKSSRKVLLAGTDLPAAVARNLLDSLGDVKRLNVADPLPDDIDTLVLGGADFPDETIYRLLSHKNHPVIQWIPYQPEDRFADIHWDAVTRPGALQEVQGRIKATNAGLVKLAYGDKILDTVRVGKGTTQFKLKFPVPSSGRNSVTLLFNDKSQDTLRFYGLPAEPYTVRFVLENPDFEVNTLAGWLGRQGNASVYDVSISTGMERSVKINQTTDPTVFVVDVKSIDHAQVKRAFQSGKSVLIWGLTNPAVDVQKVNRTFGTAFKIKRISSKELVVVEPELTAQPFALVAGRKSISLEKFPIEIQKGAGTIAVSLLNETFPVLLSGDSTRYTALWQSIFAQLRPVPKRSLAVEAPVQTGVDADMEVFGLPSDNRKLMIGKDTISLRASALNSRVSQGTVMFGKTGWQEIKSDSLQAEVYVESGKKFGTARLNSFLEAYNRKAVSDKIPQEPRPVPVPDWVWLVLIVGVLTVLWIEPKL